MNDQAVRSEDGRWTLHSGDLFIPLGQIEDEWLKDEKNRELIFSVARKAFEAGKKSRSRELRKILGCMP